MTFPSNLSNLLRDRKNKNNFRELKHYNFEVDFLSNDYLGYAQNNSISEKSASLLNAFKVKIHGATGSRLISGNHELFKILENKAKNLLNAEAALFFNSGYDANIGLLSAILKPKDIIFYDELCHASIRDGLQMSKVKAYKFRHNDYEDLVQKIDRQNQRLRPQNVYIITESVFSMNGDKSEIRELVQISKAHNAYLIVDEAHALGVCGKDFKGLSFEYNEDIFARIYTCGKALGSHGGFILGSKALKDYLINFSRPFIYTTGASPYHVAQVLAALEYFENHNRQKVQLQKIIQYFKFQAETLDTDFRISKNNTAIQYIEVKGNKEAKAVAEQLKHRGMGVKAILSPTVPEGQERIRICLHNYNDKRQIRSLLKEIENS